MDGECKRVVHPMVYLGSAVRCTIEGYKTRCSCCHGEFIRAITADTYLFIDPFLNWRGEFCSKCVGSCMTYIRMRGDSFSDLGQALSDNDSNKFAKEGVAALVETLRDYLMCHRIDDGLFRECERFLVENGGFQSSVGEMI